MSNQLESPLTKIPQEKEKILVTTGLPYTNGHLHLGHLLGYLQTDIYVRFLKHIGKHAKYICGSDMHGTPIMINAKKAGKDPLEYANEFFKEHQEHFKKFNIEFDNFYKTHSEENKELALHFFQTLKDKGLIYTKEIQQLFDEESSQFLPDRFIKGECPKCHAQDQYGDGCESCGTTYESTDLINPKSTITNTTPILKSTTHYYFKLSTCEDKLKTWLSDPNNPLQKQVRNFALGWVNEGLNDWCISRDDPYFGFEIPNSKEETGAKKYLYVWLDAPIGYLSSTMNYCNSNNSNSTWQDYWKSETSQPIHFIGKDIMYFHLLFWPAMLMEMGIELPYISVNGFITINGQKMSKSRGTFFTLKDFHELYGGEHIRFYFAHHSDRTVSDINMSFDDFKAVSNNVLLASLGNFCYRTLSFASKNYEGGLPEPKEEKELNTQVHDLIKEIKENYLTQHFKNATNNIIKVADIGNGYFQEVQPWKKRESKEEQDQVAAQVSWCVNLAKTLSILIKPILPTLAAKVEESLSLEPQTWHDLPHKWSGAVKTPQKMLDKIEIKKTKVQLEAEIKEQSNDFPVDIRVGQIAEVNDHPEADKLYVLKVDLGETIGTRQIIAGIKSQFQKDQILGKKALFIVNLQEATIRNVKSAGMTLVAESKDKQFTLLWVPENTTLGKRVAFNENLDEKSIAQNAKVLPEIDFKVWTKQKLKVQDKQIVNKQGQSLKLNQTPVVVDKENGSKIM